MINMSLTHLIEQPEVLGLILDLAHTFLQIDHVIFSMVIFPLPPIQGQLSVTGESMSTYW